MVPTTIEIPSENQIDKPFGSKNRIQIKLKATKKTTPIKIRSNKLVFIGKKPLRGRFDLAIFTPLLHQRLSR